MKRKDWTITESSTRPAGKPDRCFYCGNKIGKQHKEDCVIRGRTVVLDFTIRTVIDLPECWDTKQIEYRYNDGTWCANNLLNYLERRNKKTGCICDITTAKYIREATEDDEKDYGVTFIKEVES